MTLGSSARAPLPASRIRGLANRIAVLLLGTFGTAALAFATQLLLTRGMPVADYGRLAAMLASVNILTPVAVLGMGWFWLELFGREGPRAARWIRPAMRLGALASLASIAVLWLYVFFQASEPSSALTWSLLLVPVLLGQSLAETTAARLQLEERYNALAGWQMLTQFGRSVVAAALFLTGSVGLAQLLGGYAAVGAVAAAISLGSLSQMRAGRMRLAGHRAPDSDLADAASAQPSFKEVLRAASPYCLVTLFYLVYSQGIVALVQVLLGPEAAAIYGVAFLVTAAVYLIPNVVYVKFLAAKLLRWWTHDRPMFVAVFHLGVASHLALGLVCAGAVIAAAPTVLPMLFGDRYQAAASVLVVLAIGIPIRFVQHAYGSVLFAKEHIHRKIKYMGTAAAASLVFNFVLTPLFGVLGAAAAAVASELLLLVLYIVGVTRNVPEIDVLGTFRPSMLRAALMHVIDGEGRIVDLQPGPRVEPRCEQP